MTAEVSFAVHPTNDIVIYVGQQVPRAVAAQLQEISIRSDPYHLRTVARFTTHHGRVLECVLEDERFGGRDIACKIPELFLARLCVEV